VTRKELLRLPISDAERKTNINDVEEPETD
jgi:hypothetical protein